MSLNLSVEFPEDDDNSSWAFEHDVFDIYNNYLQPKSQQTPPNAASKLIELVQNQNANPFGSQRNMGPALSERFHQLSTDPSTRTAPSPWANLHALAARLASANGYGAVFIRYTKS